MNFATASARLSRCFLRPRIELEDFVETYSNVLDELRSLASDERRIILRECNRKHTPSELSTHQFQHLWILAHPSFQMFEAFLKDRELCLRFTEFLWIVLSARKGKHVERKKLRETSEAITKELVERYVALLQSVYPNHCLYRNRNTHLQRRLVVIHRTAPDSVTQDAIEAAEFRFLQRVSNELRFVQSEIRGTDKLLDYLLWSRRDVEEVAESLREAIAQDVAGRRTVVQVLNTSLSPLETIMPRLARSMTRGYWPQYVINNEEPDVHVIITHSGTERAALKRKLVDALSVSELQERARQMREIDRGLLPVGLKIHCLGEFPETAYQLKGHFRFERAEGVLLLPAVGTAAAAVALVEEVEKQIGERIFDNPERYEIQVCSPGELTSDLAAVLGVVWYLGLSKLRRYQLFDFKTTHANPIGMRPVVYGAGVCDFGFDWKGETKTVDIEHVIKKPGRTDVLSCFSPEDIHTINLVATLLMHHQYGGYWRGLGEHFISQVRSLLDEHQLSGVLAPLWIYKSASEPTRKADAAFWLVFDELQNYTFEEVNRLAEEGGQEGLLFQIQTLLNECRAKVEEIE